MNRQMTADWRWPLWAAAAGALGAVGHLFSIQTPSDDARAAGAAAAVAELERGRYHVGVVAGMAAVFCLLAFAAGWQRWATHAAPESLAARLAGLGLVASAGAMILGYGIKGMLAVYLPGGSDAGTHTAEGLYPLYIFDDLGPFMAWYGVAMAAAAVAWISLRERRLPIWIGVASALFAAAPVLLLVLTGLPGFPGVVDPFWLVIVGAGLAVTFRVTERTTVVRAAPRPAGV